MTASGLWAQIDVHSHAITESYMDFIRTHGAEMDEGFPIPSWKVEEHLAFMDKAGFTSLRSMPTGRLTRLISKPHTSANTRKARPIWSNP